MTDAPKIPDRYLGDGVYARWDGWQIWIRLDNGIEEIALEPEVLQALMKYHEYIISVYKGDKIA
jgi:hypothetical protein